MLLRNDSLTHSEPEVATDSVGDVIVKRVTSERRSRRRENLYSGGGAKRRRRSPHPSSVYRLSLPRLWQPWNDRSTPPPVTVPGSTCLQTALENLRCLSVLQSGSSSFHQGAAAATAVTTSTSGNVTPYVHRLTPSASAIGRPNQTLIPRDRTNYSFISTELHSELILNV